MRLAANTGAALALIEPLGFEMDDTRLKRAGLDYRDLAVTTVFPDYAAFREAMAPRRVFAFTARATRRYDRVRYRGDDVLLFGPESRGLPEELLAGFDGDARLCIPMRPGSRSINLANAVSIALYEAWRQMDFR